MVIAQQIIELARAGDPAAIQQLAGLPQLMNSLGTAGVGRTLGKLQQAANGAEALADTANGIYCAVDGVTTTVDGKTIERLEKYYRKYAALLQAVNNYKEVDDDTESRRTKLRQQIQETMAKNQSALTAAEVDKLKSVVVAQGVELSAIDSERAAAAARVQVQEILNRSDTARQEQARLEDTTAALQEAGDKLAAFLKPDSKPLQIPAPQK